MAVTTRRQVLAALGCAQILASTVSGRSATPLDEDPAQGRDKELFLEAAENLAAGKFVKARLMLHTIINTYTTSPLVPQAWLLVFFSHASETPRWEGGGKLLNDIDDYLKRIGWERKVRTTT